MATATGNYPCDNSTLANFQAWSGALYNAFIAFGWLQTSDTGQAANPPSAVPSSAYVYWIFKSNDSQSSTLPIYVKVEIGYSSTSPRIRMTVGTASNGSGTITGQVTTSAPWEISQPGPVGNYGNVLETNNGSTQFPCYFSGDAGEFRMYLWQSVSVITGVLFVIERSKDSSGAKTADYFTVAGCANRSTLVSGNFQQQQTILSGSSGNLESGIINPALTSGSGSGAALGTVAALPVFPVYGKVGNPMLGLMAVAAGDVADGAIVTVTNFYGGTHTAVGVKGATVVGSNTAIGISSAFGYRSNNGSSMAGLMRYE